MEFEEKKNLTFQLCRVTENLVTAQLILYSFLDSHPEQDRAELLFEYSQTDSRFDGSDAKEIRDFTFMDIKSNALYLGTKLSKEIRDKKATLRLSVYYGSEKNGQ